MSTSLLEAPVPVPASMPAHSGLRHAIERALARVPPLWPLRNFVAVNPYLGFTGSSFASACSVLQRTTGTAPLLAVEEYLAAYEDGCISRADLAAAAGGTAGADRMIAAARRGEPKRNGTPVRTLAEFLDATRPRSHWAEFVVEEVAKWCAVRFDDNQTTWRAPWAAQDLYTGWREAARHDRNPEIAGLRGFRGFVAALPADSSAAIILCLHLLKIEEHDAVDFLHRQLLTISGWAGHVQYRVREDAMRGRANAMLRDLLAIRLAFDAALGEAFRDDAAVVAGWPAPSGAGSTDLEPLLQWHHAYELGYQRKLARQIAVQRKAAPPGRASVQAVFCIDVRSEIFRRHLEAALPSLQTLGFAGFFGFPVAHHAGRAQAAQSRAPVLLVPDIDTEPAGPDAQPAAEERQDLQSAWHAFKHAAPSCFSYVEALGLTHGLPLLAPKRAATDTNPAPRTCARSGSTALVEFAQGALLGSGLAGQLARLVVLCGHGSESANNPHASSLDCGACGGHAGDINARIAAQVLNDPAIREALAARGLVIPADTWFVAGLHHTVTDEVTLFDLAAAPSSHAGEIASFRAALATAAVGSRRERAGALGLGDLDDAAVAAALQNRVRDGAQVRPEWGLANNAAFIAAPRSRTAGLNLQGRAFLHEYDSATDPEGSILTQILAAPVVVASWINLQYYASRVDPARYGAGNKVLHHVAGGIGVMEGNGGDLRVGLPWQSIHDGIRFRHEPRRLSVYVAASRSALERALAAAPGTAQLVDGGWIHLFALEGSRCFRRRDGGWEIFFDSSLANHAG
jgi:uncharacterized protein YbcC (UPF0753/DUF2309 family)